MFKFFKKHEKHQKKLLAIFSVGLMVAFMLPSAITNYSGRDRAYGRVAGGTIMGRDVTVANNEWEMLKRSVSTYRQGGPNGIEQVSITDELGPEVGDQIEKHSEMYALLQHEARAMHAGASPGRLAEVKARHILKRGDPDSDAKLDQALMNFLTVQAAFDRVTSAVKVSDPMREHELAEKFQTVRVNLVEFDAKNYLDQVSPPTVEETTKQFNEYKSRNPQDPGNELGYGYKIPNRVKLQYLVLPREELRKAVAGEVDPVEAQKYYLRHQGDFPSTQPAAVPPNPLTLSPAPPPKEKPATRPFAEVRDDVYRRLADEKADALVETIVREVGSAAAADYEAWRKSNPSGPVSPADAGPESGTEPAPATSPATSAASPAPGGAGGSILTSSDRYDSWDYLRKLRDRIQAKYKVTAAIGSIRQWQTTKELRGLKDVGSSYLKGRFGLDFPVFASGAIEPFLSEADKKKLPRGLKPLPVMRFSPEFEDLARDTILFRVTEAEKAHDAPAAYDVRESLDEDVRIQKALTLARADAEKFLADARRLKLRPAAGAARKPTITTGLFPNQPGARVERFPLATRANEAFVSAAFKMLVPAADDPDKEHPVRLIELPQAGARKVVAAELDEVRPDWDAKTAEDFKIGASIRLGRTLAQSMRSSWFDYNALVARLDYKPARPPEKSQAGSPPAREDPTDDPMGG